MSSAALVLCIWYVTLTNESCHTDKWVMSHIWMCYVTHMNESWCTYKSDTLMSGAALVLYVWCIRVCASCGARANESWHTYKWVMAHWQMSHGTLTNESWHTHIQSYMRAVHVTFVSWRHCNALQHTAKYCTTLQHTATHCNTLHHTATHCNTLQHTATHCNTLQHTATHCNTHDTSICAMSPSTCVW